MVGRSVLSLNRKRCQPWEDFGKLSRVAHLSPPLAETNSPYPISLRLARIAHKSHRSAQRRFLQKLSEISKSIDRGRRDR